VRSLAGIRLVRPIGLTIALSLSFASASDAQRGAKPSYPFSIADSAPDWEWGRSTPEGCLASIPAARMYNAPVYLRAEMLPTTEAQLAIQADLMAHDVAAQMRKLVDSTRTVMPSADGILHWYSVPAQLVVIVRADGRTSRRIKGAGGDSSATRLLTAAFDSALAQGNARIFFPEGSHTDSILVRLSLTPSYPGSRRNDRAIVPRNRESEFGVFYLTEPDVSFALQKQGAPQPRYPSENERSRIEGDVLMQFVVDSNGRSVPNSFRELMPADKRGLWGDAADQHNAFVSSAMEWERSLRFEPMRVGGCAIKQMVMLPLKFLAP
jgi:hypothetical protein